MALTWEKWRSLYKKALEFVFNDENFVGLLSSVKGGTGVSYLSVVRSENFNSDRYVGIADPGKYLVLITGGNAATSATAFVSRKYSTSVPVIEMVHEGAATHILVSSTNGLLIRVDNDITRGLTIWRMSER